MPVDSLGSYRADVPRADDQLRRLESIADSSLSRLDPEALIEELLDRVAALFGADTVVVLLVDASRQQLVAHASRGLEEEVRQGIRVPIGQGFAGRVAAERRPVVLDHVGPDVVVNPLLWRRGIQSMLGVPLVLSGRLMGVMHLGTLTPRGFDDTDVAIAQLAGDRIAAAIASRQMLSDRTAAAALQRSLLPDRMPDVSGLEFATRFAAAADFGVGGDWYDAFRLPGGDVGLVIGDVAGNGLRAAVVMARMRSIVRAYAIDHDRPAVVLDRVHRKFAHFEPDELTTILYVRLDADLARFTVANAGHLPPVLAVPGRPSVLVDVRRDPPICGAASIDRHDLIVEFPPGATLVMYTDGLVERRRQSLDDRLELLRRTVRCGPVEAIASEIMDALIGLDIVNDDTAVLVVRRGTAEVSYQA